MAKTDPEQALADEVLAGGDPPPGSDHPLEEPIEPAPTAGLWGKIAWVQHHVGNVEKTGQVNFKGVRYAHMQEHGLIGVLRPLMREAGLAYVVGLDDPSQWEIRGNSYIVTVALTVADTTSGQSVTRYYTNIGNDSTDKGFNKAYTGATKYALQKFFLVPTEHIDDNDQLDERVPKTDPEAGPEKKAAAKGKQSRPTKAEVQALRELMAESGVDFDKARNKLTTYGVQKMDELTKEQFGEYTVWLQEQIAKG